MRPPPHDDALRAIHEGRLIARQLDELAGICRGALFDGAVSHLEATGILDWLHANASCLDTWPASVLYDRLRAALSDGRLDPDEEKELLSLILQIATPAGNADQPAPSALPYNDPAPDIVFPQRRFCFTGVFNFGPREACVDAVTQRGGEALAGITKKLDFLVVGAVGSEFWKHAGFGTKIEKAIAYRDAGARLAIVSEQHWVTTLT